jgi:hypothetical protein
MITNQTAVEFLIEHIKLDAMYEAKSIDEWVNIFEQAKAMEKEQIKDAFEVGIGLDKIIDAVSYTHLRAHETG